jgi:ribose transport system permease protein
MPQIPSLRPLVGRFAWLARYQGALGLLILILLAGFRIGFYWGPHRISLYNPNFRTWSNFANILEQVGITGVLAVGMTFVILTGGIDLSVGSGVAFLSCATALWVVGGHLALPVIVLLLLLSGAGIGAVSGGIIARTGLQPFVVTLAMMVSLRGLAYIITHSTFVTGLGQRLDLFKASLMIAIPRFLQPLFGTTETYNRVPLFALVLLGVVFGAQWVLTHTRFGRYVISIGGNEAAAHLSGVNVQAVKILVYALNGALVALAALMFTARTQSGSPSSAVGYELDAIASVVVGGTALTGGKGSVTGTLLGTLFIGTLSNILQLNGVDYYVGLGLEGPIILLAVLLQPGRKRA